MSYLILVQRKPRFLVSNVKSLFHLSFSRRNWLSIWIKTGKILGIRMFLLVIRIKRFFLKVKVNHIRNKFLIWYITGHGPFPARLYRFKISTSELCICNNVVVDTDHYIFDCRYTRDYHLKIPEPVCRIFGTVVSFFWTFLCRRSFKWLER